ncbi:DMT family transporter [Micromonospora sp. 4G57]|uniref:DMT family transporter n=1 Tax=Micromonospora sicca TaxID=2202420 RepID=A0ABU5JDC8_9ACTN|nr:MULTISPECIES: DMT family transporter [unclassified Micromonospora]MDZ5441980.1 DMT family transporter [Micromonospora sp. 4G57]MDZ5490593.1 DMT family transporter [Micromonospora sp. 4G53]
MSATGTVAPPTLSTTRRVAGVGLATASGVAVAVQSRINGELGVRLGDGIAAAVVSFGLGLLILLVLVPATPGGRRGLAALRAALAQGSLRPWQCLGGVCGAFLVATQGLTIGTLGVAVFTVAVVAGQSASGLLVDRAGLGPTGRQAVTPNRLVGAALTVLAVLLAVGDRLGDPGALALALLPMLAGVGIAWQQAVNGRVRGASGSALSATLVNFTVGTAALLVTLAIDVAVRGRPGGGFPTEPWLYLGGPIGIVFIALAAAIVRFTGVLLLGLATIAGQIVGAVLLDLVLPTAASHPGPATLLGAALTMVAVLIAALGPAPRR